MRDLVKSMFSFSWAMSLFGAKSLGDLLAAPGSTRPVAAALDAVAGAAERQLGSGLKAVFETGDRLQSGLLDLVFGAAPGAASGNAAPRTAGAPVFRVQLTPATQGPLWPPSEIMDEDGNFIVVGGFLLQEVAPGKVVPVPNEKGAIVSKATAPPLKDGKEDFSNLMAAPYQIVRELDLGPAGRDWELRPYSLSSGPFVGDFGGGRPRIPAQEESPYNLNASPRWNEWVAPVGADSPGYRRASYPLHQVPVWRLDAIPAHVPIGVRVDSGTPPSGGPRRSAGDDFRPRPPITLRDYLRGRGELVITPSGPGGVGNGFTHARFDFTFDDLLPNSMYGLWALRAATLLPPTDPRFFLPAPLAMPNVFLTDGGGHAAVSCELRNPFPAPGDDPLGNRILALSLTYFSDFQNWGAAVTGIATGVDSHTAMSAQLSGLSDLVTVEPPR